MCKESMLVIEVDGITHQDELLIMKDARKPALLEAAGFTVLRFCDADVLKDMTGVISFLEHWIEGRERMTGRDRTTP